MAETAYIVLDADNGQALAVMVGEALEKGWVLQGGVSVCQVLENADGHKGIRQQRMSYSQALTKTEADADDGALHMFAKDWAS